MKNLFKTVSKNITKLGALAAITMAAASCNDCFIYDYEGDCAPHYFVKFEYTMHMEKGDAFKEQVEAVDLFIFDAETGDYVTHYYKTIGELANTGYLLPVDVAPGHYNFVAWCGDENNRHFKINDNITSHTHATCRLDKRAYEGTQAVSNDNLDLLFHGKLDDADLPDEEGTYIYTIPLIRDVNNIILTLQHVSGEFDTEHKLITMLDQNGNLLHDNSIDVADEHILYKPWSLRTGTLENAFEGAITKGFDINDPDNADGSTGNFMHVEFSTSRLMADHNPIINISDSETGQTIFQIPLIKWILQLKSQRYADMEDQEYLDRKNEHELMVLLQDDGRGGWSAVQVVINGWHVIDNGEWNF